jgi:hypothetical protein
MKPKLDDYLRNITIHLGIKYNDAIFGKKWLGIIGEIQIKYKIAANIERSNHILFELERCKAINVFLKTIAKIRNKAIKDQQELVIEDPFSD